MIFLLLNILANSLLLIIFKLYSRYKIDTQQAITVNYIVASISGIIAYSKPVQITSLPKYEWFYSAMVLALIFILVFNLIAITAQRNGISVAAVASKMSLVIPVVFGIIAYNESIGLLKLIGIVIALLSVYLTSMKNAGEFAIKRSNLIFPLLVFIGSGIIDTVIKFLESNYVEQVDVPIFSATVFGFAGVLGILNILYNIIVKSMKIFFKNIIAGVLLGVPNYFSIYFLIQALRSENLDSSTVFTINNVGILLVSTMVGIIFFKEYLTLKNWIGVLLAIVSIFLVSLAV